MRLANLIIKKTTIRLMILSFVLFLFFSIIVLPAENDRMAALSNGMGSPDVSFFYSPADLEQMAQAYGEQGRAAYIYARWTFDVIFPLVYGTFLTITIAWLCGKLFSENQPHRLIICFPVFAMLFDFLENSATSLVMALYPQINLGIATLAPIFTMLKWISIGVSFLLVILMATVFVIRKSNIGVKVK